ncbi:uncharacterized protein LOC129770096 [Toxorhynchites rutilus septentrionalis]|uniref:uncharacterized protein LOC129770096 n=1 Tax=Toxorhynchites rutilus septentrionalis TaxID=329112 RepID=UPI00247A2D05|nr:uncharacterized protein LOC129770096 [Toxorhynchites rutilus septentrionalis]
MGRRSQRKKGKRKQKKSKKQDDKIESELESCHSQEPESELEPEPSPEPSPVFGPDPVERPPWEDNLRVPPILMQYDSRMKRKAPKNKKHDPCSQQMRLLRYLTKRAVGRSRVLGVVPLDKIEPLVAHNRKSARKKPQRKADMTPEEHEQRTRAARMCPCEKASPSPSQSHPERSSPVESSKINKYFKIQEAMNEAMDENTDETMDEPLVDEPVPEPMPGPSKQRRLVTPEPTLHDAGTDTDSIDSEPDSTTTEGLTTDNTGSTDSTGFEPENPEEEFTM